MHLTPPHLILDRISLNLRWLVLIGLTLTLGWNGEIFPAAKVILLTGVVENLLFTGFSINRSRLWNHRLLAVGLDFGIAAAFFFIIENPAAPFLWGFLLPLSTMLIYFGPISGKILSEINKQPDSPIQSKNYTEYAQWVYQLEVENQRLSRLSEDARKKLARDLHDGPTPSAAALAMRVNFIRRLVERDGTVAAEELVTTEELARQTTKEIRYLLFNLHPLVLETAGLLPALETLAKKLAETYGQQVSVEGEAEAAEDLDPSVSTMLFYLIEEAVSNARKHAEAEKITIRASQPEPDFFQIEIVDNGIGFNPEKIPREPGERGSPGISIMEQRAELLSGLFQIESEPGKGTVVRVVVPLNDPQPERFRCDQP